VEFTVRPLRGRLEATGGNKSAEQVTRLARLHEPLEAVQENFRRSLGLSAARGTHERPHDDRVPNLIAVMRQVRPFRYISGRYFKGHPTMPLDLAHWLDPAALQRWLEKLITRLGMDGYVVCCKWMFYYQPNLLSDVLLSGE